MYVGFEKLKGQLRHKPGVTNPGGLVRHIGAQKYGDAAMRKAAASGKSLRGKPTKRHRAIQQFVRHHHSR